MSTTVTEGMRLQKYLSRAGRASRRQAEELMLAGRVTVNGVVASELGTRVVPGEDVVALDGEPVELQGVRWIAFHKPAGLITTRMDPHGGRTVYDALPPSLRELKYVGRLDRDTEGLLLFTNQGDAAHGLQRPSGGLEREYRAWVSGSPGPDAIERLVRGVDLDDGPARAMSASVEGQDERGSTVVRLVITEGRKREVRRMLWAVGHPVVHLVRIRFGPVGLGDLALGAWRPLTEQERDALVAAAGGVSGKG